MQALERRAAPWPAADADSYLHDAGEVVVSGSVVEVLRGDVVESRHHVSIAVMDGSARLRASSGDVVSAVFARSAIKPLQALPLIEDEVVERLGLSDAELATACASHGGEPRHIDAVRSMLRKVGVAEDALACGPHPPLHEPAAAELSRRGGRPGRIHNNCSGKHAGMLALAHVNGWSLAGYHEPDHPVQRRMRAELARWSGESEDELAGAVDGCGVVTFALPLQRLALAFARFAAAARRGTDGAGRVVSAMTSHPEMVAGTDRLCTRLMRATRGRVFAKVGAEGMYCAGLPGAELGIALKVEDGARRAADPALLGVLQKLGLLTDEEMAELEPYAWPAVRNTRGDRVGELRTTITLEVAGD